VPFGLWAFWALGTFMLLGLFGACAFSAVVPCEPFGFLGLLGSWAFWTLRHRLWAIWALGPFGLLGLLGTDHWALGPFRLSLGPFGLLGLLGSWAFWALLPFERLCLLGDCALCAVWALGPFGLLGTYHEPFGPFGFLGLLDS
jgi:hypothetical protein